MGRKIDVASFLCGALTRKKNPPPKPIDNTPKKEDPISTVEPPPQVGETSPEQPPPPKTSQPPPPADEEELQNRPLQPPPGRLQPQMRAASYNQQRSRSNSAVSKLSASLSVRAALRGEDADKKKKLKHEDSIWKKTIILGEKCKVPDEDDDAILYDENGNRISTYHPKNAGAGGSVRSLSRQNSGHSQGSVYGPTGVGLAMNDEL